MSDALPLPTPPPPRWNESAIFDVLGNDSRRRLLRTLATGVSRTATELKSTTGKRLDATLKDCAELVKAGIAQTSPHPDDGRKMCYRLCADVPVAKTALGWEVDFGFCVVRFRP